MKKHLRKIISKFFPELMAKRHREYIRKFELDEGIFAISKKYIDTKGLVVQSGPFKGLNYIDCASGSMLVPKLIGSYESELIPIVERLASLPIRTIIDVGCAEGYYAVGFAKTMRDARIYAYDIDSEARKRCSQLSVMNNVEGNVIIRGECTFSEIEKVKPDLLICDCEGFEGVLLDLIHVPALIVSYILVECHDHIFANVTEVLTSRFKDTHTIEIVDTQLRNPFDYPVINFLSIEEQSKAVSEYRTAHQNWLFMTPKRTTNE